MKKHVFLILLILVATAVIGQASHGATAAASGHISERSAITAGAAASSLLSRHPDYTDAADHLLIPSATPSGSMSSGGSVSRKTTSAKLSAEPRSERAGVSSLAKHSQGVSTFRSIGAVAFVLGGLLAASAYLKKRQGFCAGSRKQRSLKIVERLPLDSKRSIVILEVEGRRLLVGAGTERIEKLADLGVEEEFSEVPFADQSRSGNAGGLRVVNGGSKGI